MRIVEDLSVGGDERRTAAPRLRDDEAVGRVAMKRLQQFRARKRDIRREREYAESRRLRGALHPFAGRTSKEEFSKC